MGRLRRLDWHEIAIWYGWANVPMFSERPSAVLPEDMYSNLLGIRIAGPDLPAIVTAIRRQNAEEFGPGTNAPGGDGNRPR
jgi:hypothetical protein